MPRIKKHIKSARLNAKRKKGFFFREEPVVNSDPILLDNVIRCRKCLIERVGGESIRHEWTYMGPISSSLNI